MTAVLQVDGVPLAWHANPGIVAPWYVPSIIPATGPGSGTSFQSHSGLSSFLLAIMSLSGRNQPLLEKAIFSTWSHAFTTIVVGSISTPTSSRPGSSLTA